MLRHGLFSLRKNYKVYYERIETSDDDCCLVGNAKRMWEVFNRTDSSVIELPFSLNFSPRKIYKAYYEKQ